MIELAANLLVAFLLVLTTSWCVLLYRRLDRLRVERSDIETFLAAVDGAVRRAEQAVAGIRDGAARGAAPARRRAGSGAAARGRARPAGRQRRTDGAPGRDRHPPGCQGHGRGQPASASAAPRGARATTARGQPAPPTAGMRRERSGRPRIDAELLKALEALR